MATVGVILTHGEGYNKKYCVVVKRWYPFKRGNYWELNKEGNKINLTEKDLEEAFKKFTNVSPEKLYINTEPVTYKGKVGKIENVKVSTKPGAFDYKYGFPKGGKEDKDADDKACALRELKEETGIILDPSKLDELSESYDGVLYYKATFEGDITNKSPLDGHKHEIFKVLWLTKKELNFIIKNEPTKCPRQFKRYIYNNLGREAQTIRPAGANIINPTPLTPKLLGEFSQHLPAGVLKRTKAETVAMEAAEFEKRISKAIINQEKKRPYLRGNGKTRKNARNNKSIKNKKSRKNSNKRTKRS